MDKIDMTYQFNEKSAKEGVEVYHQILEESKIPMELNLKLLMMILADNKDTEYGKKYNFANIHSYEEYKENVPVIEYEDIADELERMLKGEKNILTVYPFDHMNETAGTIGKPKTVPMTSKQSEIYLKYNNKALYGLLADKLDESWKKGRALCTVEGTYRREPSGITVGAASSKMAEFLQGGMDELNSLLGVMYTSPVEATIADNKADRVYLHTRFAMMDENMTGIVTAFYNQVVQLFNYIKVNYELLIRDIENGTIDDSVDMPEEIRKSVEGRLKPMPERAEKLKEIFKDGSDFQFATKVWPNLKYICGVGGASFSVYDEIIKTYYTGDKIANVYSGVTSSEGLYSFPVEINCKSSMLAAESVFMEFLPVEADDDFSQCKTIEQLEVGKEYELIITNVNGFYRYRMKDVVKVTGFYNQTPMIEFSYRKNYTINLDTEKTTETAMTQAVKKTAKELGFELFDYNVYPDARHNPPQYVFLIEPIKTTNIDREELVKSLTKHMCEANGEFEFCVNVTKRIAPPDAYFMQPETNRLYRNKMIFQGVSASQLKPVRVIKNEEQKKFFYLFREI